MKYMAIIDADEKPVSCEFIGCNGNVAPYLIGATTNIKALEQESILERIKAEMQDIMIVSQEEERIYQEIKAIIDKYKAERK